MIMPNIFLFSFAIKSNKNDMSETGLCKNMVLVWNTLSVKKTTNVSF